jgi:hypothetical protein
LAVFSVAFAALLLTSSAVVAATIDGGPSAATRQPSGVKLGILRHVVHPGDSTKVRVENGSAQTLSYGLKFSLQRLEGGRWVKLPETPVFSPAFGLPPGAVGEWQAIRIPTEADPGRYRVRKTFSLLASDNHREIPLYGYFRVCRGCDVTSAPRSGSCPEATEVDYEAPLADLPPLPPNTSRDGLDIGPSRLRLVGIGETLNVGSGRFGYELRVERQTIRRPVSLDGYTELELNRVNQRGRVVGRVAAKRQRLGAVAGPGFNGKLFAVRVPAKPGLYLFQAGLRDSQGAAVGRYADYLRVVRPVTDVRLVVSGGPIRPGSRVNFWVENRGTEEIEPLGQEFAFEVFEGGSWLEAPGSPKLFPKKLSKSPLSAGESGGCQAFQIPSDARPGLYRFSKKVELGSGGTRRLTSEFRISSR